MAPAQERRCTALRHRYTREVVHLTTALRPHCMMGAGRPVRAEPGTPATPTHLPEMKKSTTLAMTTSRPRPLRVMGEPPIPRPRVTQKSPLHRSTLSTTLKHLARLLCITQSSTLPMRPRPLKAPTSPVPVLRATTRWRPHRSATRTLTLQPATILHLHPWLIRPARVPVLWATVP